MAKNYTLEDVETLRNKSGVSYEDAVSLLEKYDGDVARALIELEKRGKLDKEPKSAKYDLEDACEWIGKMWRMGMTTRVTIERKGETLVNLPVILLVLMLILGPYAVICAFILTLVTGCNVSVHSPDKKEQTIIRGEDEKTDAPEAKDLEPSIKDEEPRKKDDDDFPSITIS